MDGLVELELEGEVVVGGEGDLLAEASGGEVAVAGHDWSRRSGGATAHKDEGFECDAKCRDGMGCFVRLWAHFGPSHLGFPIISRAFLCDCNLMVQMGHQYA